jgi:hypothetical protein
MKFTLYPIYWIADIVDDEEFDRGRLPFHIMHGVQIEDVYDRLREDAFSHLERKLGTSTVEILRNVRFALVHRYEHDTIPPGGAPAVVAANRSPGSERLVRALAACLRLIRPMRQRALLMGGNVRQADGSFDVTTFDLPPAHLLEVPEVQRLFKLRNQDCDSLGQYAPEFLRAMDGQFWKFRMAVQFHELGHFQALDWKARYLLWCSAIESIYTSHDWEHQGSLVAASRIKWLLGENSSIYAPGDISRLLRDPGLTVGQVIEDLYELRNFMAHGDRIPDELFNSEMRVGFNGGVKKLEVLMEAASFIIRTSLLRILRDRLLDNFADAAPAQAYFAGQGLTKTLLRTRSRQI